ncbi:MAG: anaerobic ribonucleoside-triphosphate reductase activating protein, partial [Propionicimonas sp.]
TAPTTLRLTETGAHSAVEDTIHANGLSAPVSVGEGELTVAGLTALSSCDWPGKLVATVFLQGCPWRCTYCHNPALLDPRAPGQVSWQQVRDLLRRRRGLLDGLVFSGGEPTRQPSLPAAMREVRELGFGVGLHTGGAYPSRLAGLLPLVDWVGLDIKALPDDYHRITRVGASGTRAFASLDLLVASGVDHEVRITVDPTVHTAEHVERLVGLVSSAGARRTVLQEVRPQGTRPEYAAALAGRRLRDILTTAPVNVTLRTAN